jgi:putative FmdB family regulatory protein
MPIYEYSCGKCGKTLEVIQKMSDKPLKTHAGCGGKLTKLISASGFQFKGTGWYVTDYARQGKTDAGEASKDGKTESPAGKEATGAAKEGTETKPATDKASSDSAKKEKPAKGGRPEKSNKS